MPGPCAPDRGTVIETCFGGRTEWLTFGTQKRKTVVSVSSMARRGSVATLSKHRSWMHLRSPGAKIGGSQGRVVIFALIQSGVDGVE